MHLAIIQPQFVDRAWKDGAACLAEACEASGGEIEGPQLKMLLARGERILVALVDAEKPVGWGVVKVDTYPNVRVLHISDLVAHNTHFERFFGELKNMAVGYGCSEVRWSCKDAQARLYKMKLDEVIEPVYTTYRVRL